MSKSTKEQIKWYREHNDEFQAERKVMKAEIAEHLDRAFKNMSKLENFFNTSMITPVSRSE